MGNMQSNAYETPLSVDLSDTQRAEVFKKEFVSDAVKHAKRSAKVYANVLLNRMEASHHYVLEKSEMEIQQVMATYGVHKALVDYAAKVCRRIVNERMVR
jgi:hypothetical protein